MKLTHVFTLLMAITCANAWSFDVTTKKNFCGKRRSFFDLKAGNDCYNLPSDVSGKVKAFSFCSMAYTRCSITLHSSQNCGGKILGSATAGLPRKFWEKKSVSKAGSKMKSFRIAGCKGIPVAGNLDVQTCYGKKAPWKKCKRDDVFARRSLDGQDVSTLDGEDDGSVVDFDFEGDEFDFEGDEFDFEGDEFDYEGDNFDFEGEDNGLDLIEDGSFENLEEGAEGVAEE